jgi:DNA polymerase I-like protein with 3'-5' exonuclease and polymerase domains
MAKTVVGLDIETYDPLLKTAGYSWKYGSCGWILATALYYEAEDNLKVIPGIVCADNNFSKEEREAKNAEIVGLLQNPDVCIVGANLQYDIGWLLYEYKMTTYDVKCSFIDVLQAEAILDEFSIHSLDTLSWKYLKYGKKKERIEEWVHENVSSKGDFRQYLKDAPWDLLEEYVKGDAKNPVKIWRKQLTLLKQQDLCKRAKMEFDCILPTLEMTRTGIPIDTEQKAKNLEFLDKAIDKLHKEFLEKYNLPKFRVTAPRDIASFCDLRNIPYKCAITLKGYKEKKFANGDETDNAYHKAKQLVSSFRLEKGKPVAYVPKEMAERTCELLKEEGFMFTCSPKMDKKFFDSKRETYPEIALIADWKLATGIRSKILGEEYNRYITKNFKDEFCIRPQFKITDTISFRYSSVAPNGQQIPSKGGFTLHDAYGNDIEISFPKLTSALFVRSKGCVFGKIDYGQIEYRLICNIACGESGAEVRRQYAENPHMDFHQYVVDLTGLSRKYAKNMSFGVSFGMGLPSMAESFGWTMEKAEEISEAYHAHMPFVAPTLALVGDVAKERGYIKTVCGSHARLPDKKKSYTMLNRYTQGSGAECLKSAIIQAYKEGLWEKLKVANTVHDELNMPYLEPTEEQMINLYRMAEIMRTAVPGLRVPLEASPELGDNWASTKEVTEWIELRDKNDEAWKSASEELKKAVNICDKLLKEGRVSV